MTVGLGVTLFQVAFWVYLTATVFYVACLININKRRVLGETGTILLLAGLLVHAASLAARTIAAERPPFLNLYEYMLSFTWGAALVYLVLELITKNRAFGGFAVPLITAFALLTYRLPSEVNPTLPALRSAWRVPHVASAVLAYAAFCVAFVLASMYLIRERAEGKSESFWSARLPSLGTLDQTVYRMIAFGFMMQTLLIITGAIWAQIAWGRYWGWDPKETWSLITWLIYAAYLHTRAIAGWRGHRSVIVVVAGFAAMIFTLFGVSFLMHGLHAYV